MEHDRERRVSPRRWGQRTHGKSSRNAHGEVTASSVNGSGKAGQMQINECS